MRSLLSVVLIASLLGTCLVVPAFARQKEARSIARLLDRGAKVVAASDGLLWLETDHDIWMCVIEINERFRSTLKRRNVRELYANWPKSLCFNAGSFE